MSEVINNVVEVKFFVFLFFVSLLKEKKKKKRNKPLLRPDRQSESVKKMLPLLPMTLLLSFLQQNSPPLKFLQFPPLFLLLSKLQAASPLLIPRSILPLPLKVLPRRQRKKCQSLFRLLNKRSFFLFVSFLFLF